MTMFSAANRRLCGGYRGEGNLVHSYGDSSIGSDLDNVGMAEEELKLRRDRESVNEGGAEESSSRDAGDGDGDHTRDQEWLQLGIGGRQSHQDLQTLKKNGSGLVELELMPSTSTSTSNNTTATIRPEFRPPRPVTNFGGFTPFFSPHQEINWPIPISVASSSSLSPYFPRPFHLYGAAEVAPPPTAALDFRVIQPPRRPHSGIWFMLQALHNQEKEPFLPQISKSYLRIKDGRMTIRVVIKYLVNKLSLDNESEIEIRCKGQRLLPFLTLQHVRDNIWSSPRDFITLLPNSSTTNHIMVLHYARTNSSN